MPRRTAQHFGPGPFARFIGECLRLVRAPTPNPDDDRVGLAVQLINDIDREHKLNELTSKFRRLLAPLCQYEAVSIVGRLIERGKADARRIPSGTTEIEGDGRPALFEFADAGSLCFYASAVLWRTIRVKPRPRARIVRLAEDLLKATRRRGRRL
jgi:hypothetical protein